MSQRVLWAIAVLATAVTLATPFVLFTHQTH